MTSTQWQLRTLAAALVSTSVAMPARAQSSIDGWRGLKTEDLQTIYVKDTSGRETAGKLLHLNPDSLVLLVDGGERRVDLNDVTRIQKRDSLRNGTLIGLTAGVVMGIIAGGLSDCPSGEPGGSCAGFRVVAVAVSGGVYAGLGAGIDALVRGRSTLYEYGRESVSRRSSGVGLTLARVSW